MKPGLLAAVGGKKEGVAMRLVIDCFKLVKGLGKSIGIYNLAKNLTAHLAQTNQTGNTVRKSWFWEMNGTGRISTFLACVLCR